MQEQQLRNNRRTGRTTRIFEKILKEGDPITYFVFPTRNMARYAFNTFRNYIEDQLPLENLSFNLSQYLIRIKIGTNQVNVYFKGNDDISEDSFRGLKDIPKIIYDHTMHEGFHGKRT